MQVNNNSVPPIPAVQGVGSGSLSEADLQALAYLGYLATLSQGLEGFGGQSDNWNVVKGEYNRIFALCQQQENATTNPQVKALLQQFLGQINPNDPNSVSNFNAYWQSQATAVQQIFGMISAYTPNANMSSDTMFAMIAFMTSLNLFSKSTSSDGQALAQEANSYFSSTQQAGIPCYAFAANFLSAYYDLDDRQVDLFTFTEILPGSSLSGLKAFGNALSNINAWTPPPSESASQYEAYMQNILIYEWP